MKCFLFDAKNSTFVSILNLDSIYLRFSFEHNSSTYGWYNIGIYIFEKYTFLNIIKIFLIIFGGNFHDQNSNFIIVDQGNLFLNCYNQ